MSLQHEIYMNRSSAGFESSNQHLEHSKKNMITNQSNELLPHLKMNSIRKRWRRKGEKDR